MCSSEICICIKIVVSSSHTYWSWFLPDQFFWSPIFQWKFRVKRKTWHNEAAQVWGKNVVYRVQLSKLWWCVCSCCLVFRERQEVSGASLGLMILHFRSRVFHYSTIPVGLGLSMISTVFVQGGFDIYYNNFPLEFSIVSHVDQL